MFHNGLVQRLLKHSYAIGTGDALGLPESRISEQRSGLSYARTSSFPKVAFHIALFGVPAPLLGFNIEAWGCCEYASLASRATDINLRTMLYVRQEASGVDA